MPRSWTTLLPLLIPWKRHHSPPSLISPDLLHSNRPPTEAEVTEVQAYIAQLNSTLVRLEGRRSKHAVRFREFIQKQLNDHKLILSSFRRLPYEIILMIFLMCPQGGNLTDAPLVLCRICSQWRNIALESPQLWRNPTCIIRDGRFDPGLQTWLKLSGQVQPLNFSLHLEHCYPLYSPHYDRFIEVAKSVSQRWKSLTIFLSNSSDMSGLIYRLDTTNLPQLESLTISNLWNSNTKSHKYPTLPPHHLFSTAPHLRALTIEGIPAPIVPRFVFVKNLTKLHMRAIRIDHTPEEYLELLAQCSNLTHCAIHCRLMPRLGEIYPLARPRTLPKLKHLQIEGYCLRFRYVGVLLYMLTLPQLEFISVEFRLDKTAYSTNLVPNPADHPRDEFRTLIEKSAYTLSLDPRPVDPYFFEMVASVSPARMIWTCDGDWYRTSYPDYFRRHRCPGPLPGSQATVKFVDSFLCANEYHDHYH
jgi:hypothetical protein